MPAANEPKPEWRLRGGRYLRRVWRVSFVMINLYILSFGPACWVMTRRDAGKEASLFRAFSSFYQPVSISIIRSPMWARDGILSYLQTGAADDTTFIRDWPEGIGWSKPGYTYTVLSIPVGNR